MTSLAALTEATLNMLYGLDSFEYPLEDRLDGSITSTTESIGVDTSAMWQADDFAEFADGELVKFIADASGGSATVKRGQRGTTAAAQADDAEMVKNPEFPRTALVQSQINAAIRLELWPQVWSWHKDSLTASFIDFMYDLDQYVEQVVLVYQEDIDADGRMRPLPPGWWDVETQISTAVATNSNLLIIHRVYDYDETVYYTAKRRPHVDDLANVSDEIADLIPYAAAARCMVARSPHLKNDAARAQRDRDGGLLRDYRALRAEFEFQKGQLHRILMEDVRPDLRWRAPTRAFGRSW